MKKHRIIIERLWASGRGTHLGVRRWATGFPKRKHESVPELKGGGAEDFKRETRQDSLSPRKKKIRVVNKKGDNKETFLPKEEFQNKK